MVQERRKCARFQLDEEAFVVLHPDFSTLGKLVDISEAGLSFQHMENPEERITEVDLDIFTGDSSIYLQKVPGTVVYDYQEESTFCFEHRRCGVRFGELDEHLAASLQEFIQQFKKDPAQKTHEKKHYCL